MTILWEGYQVSFKVKSIIDLFQVELLVCEQKLGVPMEVLFHLSPFWISFSMLSYTVLYISRLIRFMPTCRLFLMVSVMFNSCCLRSLDLSIEQWVSAIKTVSCFATTSCILVEKDLKSVTIFSACASNFFFTSFWFCLRPWIYF